MQGFAGARLLCSVFPSPAEAGGGFCFVPVRLTHTRGGRAKERSIMLQVDHLTLTHRRDLTDLVRDLSFTLSPGEHMALIG